MKVKMKIAVGEHEIGDVLDLSDKKAGQFVGADFAEFVKAPAKKKAPAKVAPKEPKGDN